MSPQDAYVILRKRWPICTVLSCLDFGSFYGFELAPVGENDSYRSGPYVYSVNKKNGKVSIYNITTDPDLYLSATEVEIKDVMSTRLSEVRLN